MDRGAWRATVHSIAESETTEQLTLSLRIQNQDIDKYNMTCTKSG